jgi:hypothetical protein
MRFLRSWLLLPTLLISSILVPQRHVFAQPPPAGWSRVAGIPPTVQLNAVMMIDALTAWSAGADHGGGVLYQLRWQGSQWTVSLEGVFRAPLRALSAISTTNIWAVGDQGLIVHKDVDGWHEVSTPVPSATFTTIQMFGGGEEGWAAGFDTIAPPQAPTETVGILLHYQDGAWRQSTRLADAGALRSLHFPSATNGWLAGDTIWHYQSGAWSQQSVPPVCPDTNCTAGFAGIVADDQDEVWVVGGESGICAICVSHPYMLARAEGRWQTVELTFEAENHFDHYRGGVLRAVSRGAEGTGLAVGGFSYSNPQNVSTVDSYPLIFRFSNGQWRQEVLPVSWEAAPIYRGTLLAVSMADAEHALSVGENGLVLAFGYGALPDPDAKVSDPHSADVLYFGDVGHSLGQPFRSFWERNGGLPVFGYPLTEAFSEVNTDTGSAYMVQYFERQRYEAHPENQGTPYEVLLGRLGDEVLRRQGRDWQSFPQAAPTTPHYFPQTGHAIDPVFWDYWNTHGLELGDAGVSSRESLALFGYPLSEAEVETNSSGDTVLTQWFERARFEYHPNNPDPYKILLGHLAVELRT